MVCLGCGILGDTTYCVHGRAKHLAGLFEVVPCIGIGISRGPSLWRATRGTSRLTVPQPAQ
jgi:hypothetical protein